MNTRPFILPSRLLVIATAAIALPVTFNSCRPKEEPTATTETQAIYVAELHQNSLSKTESSFIASQGDSPVHWQGWDRNLSSRASSERKTIFALIGSGTDANTLEILKQINKSPSTCTLLNEHHVNVLIDSNIHPDLEFFAAMLCIKSRSPVATPLLIWFSYEGKPISWSPVGPRSSRDIDGLISRMSNTVYQVWRDDPDYVLKNSRDDFTRRMESTVPEPLTEDTTGLTLRSVRQAASLFDPTSGSIDGIGNLSPARYINLLIQASYHPDSSETQKKRYTKTAILAADHFLVRGLIDPLDGGVYAGTQKTTSALPQFTKTLGAQAHSMKALYGLYKATGDARYLKAADSISTYTQKHLVLPEGGHLLGIIHASNQALENPCIWTIEEIEAALTEDESRICTLAFGLKGLGNIPLVDDPDRSYFRKNTLTWKVSLEELAAQTSLDPSALQLKLESITKKLAKLRTEKPYKPFVEKLSTSGSSALYAGACIAGYRATSDEKHLKKAQSTLAFVRENFLGDSGKLHHARFNGTLNLMPATGSDYALVCQAALDLHEVTLNPDWLQWAHEIHTQMNSLLSDSSTHLIKEYDGTNYPQTYKTEVIYTLHALNNISTWSIAYSNAYRLTLRATDETITAQKNSLESILLRSASTAPIASIDFLTVDSILNLKRVYIKTPATSELRLAACKSQCQIISVTEKGSYPELGAEAGKLPGGSATVVLRGKVIGTASTVAELETLLK